MALFGLWLLQQFGGGGQVMVGSGGNVYGYLFILRNLNKKRQKIVIYWFTQIDRQVTSFLFMKYRVEVGKWDRKFAHPFF